MSQRSLPPHAGGDVLLHTYGDVLDTFVFKNGLIYLKEFHLARSFEAYQLIFPQASGLFHHLSKIYDQLEKYLRPEEEETVRLTFSAQVQGQHAYQIVKKLPLSHPVHLEMISSITHPAGQGSQSYKWANREAWATLMAARLTDADDVIAVNTLGKVVETSRFNLFFYDHKLDQVFTPPLNSGCINGVYRRYVLSEKCIDLPVVGLKPVIEKDISVAELESEPHIYTTFVANSARGVLLCQITKSPVQKN